MIPLILLLPLSSLALADADESPAPIKAEPAFGWAGMIAVGAGPKTISLHFGGPRLTATVANTKLGPVRVAASMFPSVVYDTETWQQPRPSLGMGVDVSIGQLVIAAPVYYIDGYRPTIGLGVRF